MDGLLLLLCRPLLQIWRYADSFGNPQNLYLYGKFQIPDLEFISTMFLPFLYSIILITITCLIFVKSTPMKLSQVNSEKLDGKRRH